MSKKYGLRTVKFWVRYDPESGQVRPGTYRTRKAAEAARGFFQVVFQVKGHYVRNREPGKSLGLRV